MKMCSANPRLHYQNKRRIFAGLLFTAIVFCFSNSLFAQDDLETATNDSTDLILVGSVVHQVGKPISNAKIVTSYSNIELGVSDAEGKFRVEVDFEAIKGVADRFLIIAPSEKRLIPVEIHLVSRVEKGSTIEFEAKMRPGVLLQGQVIETNSSLPIVSSIQTTIPKTNEVRVVHDGRMTIGEPRTRHFQTDAEGRFRIVVPTLDHQLRVTAKDSARFERIRGHWSNSRVFVPAHRLEESPQTIKLKELDSQKITIVGSNGENPTRLVVRGDKPFRSSIEDSTSYNAAAFTVFGSGPRYERILTIVDPDTSEGAALVLNSENLPGDNLAKQITLKPCATIKGKLKKTTPESYFPPNVFVVYGKQELAYSTVDEAGQFEIKNVIADLPVFLRFRSGSESRFVPFSFAAGQTVDLGTVDMETLCTVEGIVVDADNGEPVVGASISFPRNSMRDEAETDRNGRFKTKVSTLVPDENLLSDLYVFVRTKDKVYVDNEIKVDLNDTKLGGLNLEIKLPRRNTLAGQIIDQRTGEPVSGTVTCRPSGFAESNNRRFKLLWQNITRENGEFLLDVGTRNGQLEFVAERPGQFRPVPGRPGLNAMIDFDLDKDSIYVVKLEPEPFKTISIFLPDGTAANAFQAFGGDRKHPKTDKQFPDLGENPKLHSNSFDIFRLGDAERRLILVYSKETGEHLGAARMLDTNKPSMIDFEDIGMAQCARLNGTLGESARFQSAKVLAWMPGSRESEMIQLHLPVQLNDNNSFQIEGLIPGLSYAVTFRAKDPQETEWRTGHSRTFYIHEAEPNQQIEFGEVDVFFR